MPNMVLIDGNSLVYKAYYALPLLTNSEGLYTNGIYGFTMMLFKIFEEYKPDYIAVAFDKKAPTFRHKEYDQYKANRKGMPEELIQQLPLLKDVIKGFNIPILEIEGYEADDIIGTLAKKAERMGMHVFIVTGDRDSLQLVSDNITSVISKKGTTEVDVYTPDEVKKKIGVWPAQITDYKGLAGDKSDNIPGVPGIGSKTAISLLSQYNTLENLLENLDTVDKKKTRELLAEYREQAVLSKKLATIEVNIPIELDMNELKMKQWNYKALRDLFSRLEFKSLMGKLPAVELVEFSKDDFHLETASSQEALKSISREMVAVDYIIDREQLIYLALYDGKRGYFLHTSDGNEDISKTLKPLFEDDSIKKLTYNIKGLMTYLGKRGICLKGIEFDAAIAAYLINSIDSEYPISSLTRDYLGYSIKEEYELLGQGKGRLTYRDVAIKDIQDYAAGRIKAIFELYNPMIAKLKDDGSFDLYKKIEIPLIEVLSSMEQVGFKIDKNELNELAKEFDFDINRLTNEIYELAGEEFNINSPKQLSYILFEKLKLPVIKKTKTGYSTDAEVLDELSSQHDIVEKILRYRTLVKLRNTYISGFMKLLGDDDRLHTTFMQTVTSTGRISSTEPNLQNIPVRDEIGRRIRKIFIPRDEEHLIMSADYSQIELRVLAHLSGDANLINAFINNEDIHARTASEVFGVPIEEVTPQMRRSAKAVNFGIVYGISDFGLAKDLKISRSEAQQYINNYFRRYPGVKAYLDECIEQARKKGYVTTIYNRRRYIPEINSKNYSIRTLGERIAMNTPIQGSAADIIKAAMDVVYDRLKKAHLDSRLILQVHDELILDVAVSELEQVKDIVKDSMENVVALKVPLLVDISVGRNWFEAK
ncbi:DNA polymerase I [Caldanaerobius fijiensis DSM 17918]|uniref:DNA polymerase I n=1 Tax=Caldanaerobius fijiensis DSM 17918 TaxID=1121256 RepID=A0A1M4VK00_9THEO|nr:DNA polymerase I [Caldanaerobius fijiensis]SHE69341.1 DNA polymerase I [Caldanaerobius fijiensis DSM 17918]